MLTEPRPVTLMDGTAVTVRAWSLTQLAEHSEAFMALQLSLNTPLHGRAAPHDLLTRAVQISLAEPADLHRLRPGDLPDVLDAIYEVNGLHALTKAALALQLERHGDALDVLRSQSTDT